MRQHAQQVQGIRVLSLLREELLVEPGRRSQLARLVHGDRGRQKFLHERESLASGRT